MSETQEVALKDIKEYIWARYIENEPDVEPVLPEEQMLEVLDQYYEEIPPSQDPEVYYYGILLFEAAYERSAKKDEYFIKSKQILEMYRDITGERNWEAIEDRLSDIDEYLESRGISVEVVEEDGSAAAPVFGAESDERIALLRAETPPGMVLVPAGKFLFGPDRVEKTLDSYYVDIYPVTNEEYRKFIDETGYRPSKFQEVDYMSRPRQPVVGVSYFDAQQFATWAGKALPTHEQWEKAARGTDGRRYPWGENIDPEHANYGQESETSQIKDIGSYPLNVSPFGAFEMVGNIWQWTDSWFDAENKIIKGGSWCDPEDFLECHYVLYAPPKEKQDLLGFRCVKPTPKIGGEA